MFDKATTELYQTKKEFMESNDNKYKRLLTSHLIVLQAEVDEIIRIIRITQEKIKKSNNPVIQSVIFASDENLVVFLQNHIN